MSQPDRPYNFSAGPGILPLSVFERTSADVRRLVRPGDDSLEARLSILEISHRCRTYEAIHNEAVDLCHDVLGIPRTHEILFLQGGASLQFSMVPMNLRVEGKSAAYVDTGAWSSKAIKESKLLGATTIVASSKDAGYDHIPDLDSVMLDAPSYLHITSNNTIYGTEWSDLPDLASMGAAGVPLVVDMSSNIGSRPMPLGRVALGYAGAQKNLGPSGLTLVFIHRDLLGRSPAAPVPTMLRYSTHAETNSLFNTPNTFGILVLHHVLEWVRDEGGTVVMGQRNAAKAGKLYDVLERSALYRPHARAGSRSTMNVTWTLTGSDDAEVESSTKRFLAAATAAGMSGLKGHRSVGGIRASIYNAFPEDGVDVLCEFMREFERKG
jgi:phosphoserine aminotransferase